MASFVIQPGCYSESGVFLDTGTHIKRVLQREIMRGSEEYYQVEIELATFIVPRTSVKSRPPRRPPNALSNRSTSSAISYTKSEDLARRLETFGLRVIRTSKFHLMIPDEKNFICGETVPSEDAHWISHARSLEDLFALFRKEDGSTDRRMAKRKICKECLRIIEEGQEALHKRQAQIHTNS